MKTVDFNYHLPQELIAQCPMEPRDHSRLMIVDKEQQSLTHRHFYDVVSLFQKGDVLVWNNSKVFKARLSGQLVSKDNEPLRDHDKPVEIFLVRPMENEGVWKVLAKPGKHVRHGTRVIFADDFSCDVLVKEPNGTLLVQFPYDEKEVRLKANTYGQVPLPPYVKDEKHALESYQTMYASDDHEGSVAAPTAGFHFTDDIIDALQKKGVIFTDVTLHVGLGTFLPVKTEKLDDHVMHEEWVELSQDTVDIITTAKKEGRRVVAVGTTSVRVLEGVHALLGNLVPYEGDIDVFIRPGFSFDVVDALITNFHLPKSTLLMLVSSFVGNIDFTLSFYEEAVREKYRFFSFGDAMFIS
ncbi:MAG: tRNA preQ1(34) S-adenosylmethionine ribosyltransferase-isomerase QueA [Candidatus Magasanikbacteria bacterium]|jgi:S-adenosylmethionine:tRNA ribosyltransferase-isomerase|nr:tRNA preQ1(34) S-adenosylmethionine ribosyltransferase-isomerase QueA [Candidatus Magasanikbacteria bacterium]MBT4220746.1 tRNA preQ1(34) S-adenosylmethionine ribosyltransferase-isomerase QueA [Candidatus Magasanikbacteria bacterium]MBT4350091.1 tRNA preQ1(34) S-adenosylmethionine ribosyltransferase-isomerase QueA [Candidatus Magasanikbacteria bacterium]MBT4541466.1 tRNA preQ1(34) S-adenosylmethionine ribosyltransferase-isomerase QueA [Candidatus Magasanikbacteria bacterium]MBT6252994.1 tRNA